MCIRDSTTYVIGLSPEGYVGHVYYGPLLHGEPDLYPLRMDEPPFTPSVNKREKSSFLDRFPMEYPTGGVGDYRESCLNIRNAPVSYTHLDVYKRQERRRFSCSVPTENSSRTGLSCTHLRRWHCLRHAWTLSIRMPPPILPLVFYPTWCSMF